MQEETFHEETFHEGAVLSASALCKSYRQGPEELAVLKGLDLHLGKGELLAVVGASGSGKSTMLNLLGGLDKPDSGSVVIMGQDLGAVSESRRAQIRNQHLGFVYQFHHLLAEFNAVENVAMPLLIAKQSKAEAKERAEALLEAVGLQHRLKHRPSALSGGERQRVAIARALANHPSCVLMDEPTGNLDRETANQVLELLLELNRELDISFVVVSHDEYIASRMDRIVQLEKGRLSDYSPLKAEA